MSSGTSTRFRGVIQTESNADVAPPGNPVLSAGRRGRIHGRLVVITTRHVLRIILISSVETAGKGMIGWEGGG